MPAGRPSKYDPRYCDEVIGYGEQGKSRTWIAATIGVTRQTLGAWEQEHPEFLHSMAMASMLSQKWWEDAGQIGMVGGEISAPIWSRSMAARFPAEWREKTLMGSDPENPLPAGVVVRLVKTDATDG